MTKDARLRMISWLLVSAALYGSSILLVALCPPSGVWAQLQTGLWKLGNITVGAFLGYWADRHLYGRMGPTASTGRQIARALIVAASILGVSLGL